MQWCQPCPHAPSAARVLIDREQPICHIVKTLRKSGIPAQSRPICGRHFERKHCFCSLVELALRTRRRTAPPTSAESRLELVEFFRPPPPGRRFLSAPHPE